MERARVGIASLALLLALLGGSLVGSGAPSVAQEATPVAVEEGVAPARPVHIHSGNCNTLGDVVYPLTELTAPAGEAVGQRNRVTVAQASFTVVPATLETILAEDHAINAHLSADEIGTYLACGEIGGPFDANGALVIGLRETDGSGFAGIAYLIPGADGVSTSVSVFLAEDLTGGRGGGGAADDAAAEEPAADAADEADAGAAGETVDVSLTEWAIDMPVEYPAGAITFNVTNDGTVPHTIEVEGEGIEEVLEPRLAPGESGSLTVDLAPGTYTVYCPVGDGAHRERGMELEITVA